MIDNELLLLAVLSVSIFSMLVLLLSYLTVRKSVDIRKRKSIESYKEKYNPLIFSMLSEGLLSRELTPETPLQFKAIEELLSRYAKVLEGKEEKERLFQLASMYLTDRYQKQLMSKKWSTRMNTLYHIEDFQMIQLAEEVRRLAGRRRISHEELLHALRILALAQHPDLFALLTGEFVQLSELDLRNILVHVNAKQFDQLLLHFHKSHTPLKKAILDVISIRKEVSYLTFVENIFASYQGEVRLRAIKALAEIGYVEDAAPYLQFLYSQKWEERMMAAKLMGSLREAPAIPRLIELLHDQSWWVRSQAGQAIAQFANGKEILQAVLDESSDPFAKDMAWEWLYKGV
ncbi:HEAT repeat domain-containing protein [Neobacillus dielmonensis]|uniref:HEAT repeat domain-containing protein n=1 Tax=Neobacillus dielmonensis TaxID=1347369 RepID=UPI0005AA5D85|nr:HEAT repeat domain-containing protein [Neobacillus dielmonensis]